MMNGPMTIEHEKSRGNVFADLGFPNSEQELVKAKGLSVNKPLRDCAGF